MKVTIWNLFAVLGMITFLAGVGAVVVGCVSTGTKMALDESQQKLAMAEQTAEELRMELAGSQAKMHSSLQKVDFLEGKLAAAKADVGSDQGRIQTLEDALEDEVNKAQGLVEEIAVLNAKVTESQTILSEKTEEASQLRNQADQEQEQDRDLHRLLSVSYHQ